EEQVMGVLGELRCASVADLVTLHARLGHAGFERMIRIVQGGTTLDLSKLAVSRHELEEARQQIRDCKACCQGKGTRTPREHRGLDRGDQAMAVLHMDSFQVKKSNGELEYGLAVKDLFTDYRWVATSETKDQLALEV